MDVTEARWLQHLRARAKAYQTLHRKAHILAERACRQGNARAAIGWQNAGALYHRQARAGLEYYTEALDFLARERVAP